ncbi:hypothetical protein GCM10009839_79320 [Catenulispora yoronensis]|uniref:DUF4132 domain-containing protein n=1 Tax=Catenulispora yoronensis TaxID=450799 RepID=A0ABN2VC12_9ACTN
MFVLPARMRDEVIRWRGEENAYVPPAEALEVYLQRQHDALLQAHAFREAALAGSSSDTALLAQIRRPGFGDPAQASPLQTALSTTLVQAASGVDRRLRLGYVESWVLGRGPGYAFRALAELYDVHATWFQSGGSQHKQGFVRGIVEELWVPDLWLFARRLLELLAGVSEAEYLEVQEIAQEYRGGARAQRALTSFLFRERVDWVDADLAELIPPGHYKQDLTCYLLVSAITEGRQVEEFARHQRWLDWPRHAGPLETLLASVGAEALPVLVGWLDDGHHYKDARPRLLALISELGSDGAIRALIERIATKDGQATVLAAGDRFPQATLRVLAETDPAAQSGGSEDSALWSQHVTLALRLVANAHQDAARAVLPALDPTARFRLEAALEPARDLPERDAETDPLPPILVSPPWRNRAAPAKPVVVQGLTAPDGASVVWAEGERERWAATPLHERRYQGEADDATLAALFAQGKAYPGPVNLPRFACRAADEVILPLLESGWQPNNTTGAESWGLVYLARFELLALPITDRLRPADRLELLAPFRSPGTAVLMADAFSRTKSLRAAAARWLARHPEYAAEQLIPAAVGKPGKDRRAAIETLRWLDARGHAEVVAIAAIAAKTYGDKAADAVRTLIEADGTEDVPKTMPALPHWAEPFALPQLASLGHTSALPPEAVRHVVQMLSISKPETPYPGLDIVRETCDDISLREFCWALVENWRLAGCPSAQGWVLDSLRWFGDYDIVRRLEPLIRAWPGENGHARAVAGLDVLAAIGGDHAMRALYRISQRVKFTALKDSAGEKIAAIAEGLGRTAEQLGDQLVPDLGLDPDGTLTLDFGPRKFVVGFDELLKPYVRDEAGQRLKTLPKPGVKDDPELAKAATDAFSALKKEARSETGDQIARLERAMCLRRRWTLLDFCSYFVAHPLVRHLVRRLVWGSYDADGTLLATFRIAEDLTFADLDDEPFEPDIATVGLVHPLEFAELIPRWSDVLADYEILQPFAQLGRETHTLTDAERETLNLSRFRGVDIPVGKLVGLTRRGWRRGEAWDNGVEVFVLRPLPDGRALVANIEPGIDVGGIADSGPQELTDVWIARDGVGDWFPRDGACDPFGTLDPVTASEILRDLTEVTDLTGMTGGTAR